MDKDKQRIAIAEACGWRVRSFCGKNFIVPPAGEYQDPWKSIGKEFGWQDRIEGIEVLPLYPTFGSYKHDVVPDYTDCLNAIHAAILQLVTSKIAKAAFSESLTAIINRNHDGEHRFLGASPFHHATAEASELCEALLIQQRLWTPTGEENE